MLVAQDSATFRPRTEPGTRGGYYDSAVARLPTVIIWGLFGLVVVGTPLALGGLHTPVLALAAIATAALLGAVLRFERDRLTRLRGVAMLVLGAGSATVLYTAFQAIPLPAGLVGFLSPETALIWSRSLSPLREAGPRWITLSLDPVATRLEIVRGATYLGIYVSTLVLARRRSGTLIVERILVGGGVIMALVTLAHPALHAERVFGTYAPDATYAFAQWHIAPLLNVNHLAGFCHVSFCIALHQTLTRREGLLVRVLPMCAGLLLLATNTWAASRAGSASIVLGALLVSGGVLVLRRAHGGGGKLPVLVALGGVFGGAAVYLALFSEARIMLFEDQSLTKVTLIREAGALARAFPLFGVGRGAFESTFPAVRKLGGYVVFTHPENIAVQWASEWGLVVAIALGLVILFAMRWSVAAARSRPPVGAWAGLCALGVHNLADFNLEVPGIAIVAAVALGLLTAGERVVAGESETSSNARAVRTKGPVATAFALAVALVLGSVLALASWNHELVRERSSVFERTQAAARTPSERAQLDDLLRAAMLRHPAEPYFPYVGAVIAQSRGGAVIPWVSRTLERSPVHGRANLVLARSLRVRGPAQARLSYRFAYEQDDALFPAVVKEAPALVATFDDAMSLIAPGESGLRMMDALAGALGPTSPEIAGRLDETLIARAPKEPGPLGRRAAAILENARKTHDMSAASEGTAFAARYREKMPLECRGYALEAELEDVAGHVSAALDVLNESLERTRSTEVGTCLRLFVKLADRERAFERSDHAIDRVSRRPCVSDDACAQGFSELGALEDGRGNARRAIGFYRRAYDRAHHRAELVTIGMVGMRSKIFGEAIYAYTELSRLEPNKPEWKSGLEAAKSAVQEQRFRINVAPSAAPGTATSPSD